jgi:hypothetical protein
MLRGFRVPLPPGAHLPWVADVSVHRFKIGEASLRERSPHPKRHRKKRQDHPAEKGNFAEHTTYFFAV